MYIDFVSISGATSSCSISLNVGIVICIVSSVSVCPVNKIVKKKKTISQINVKFIQQWYLNFSNQPDKTMSALWHA